METLLLNASHEPLRVISVKRAIVMVMNERAEVLEESEFAYHSERQKMQIPIVIRLRKFVKIPFMANIKLTKSSLIKRDHGLCGYCREPGENIDHIKPRPSQGGKHTWQNVVWSCKKCNSYKANRTPQEAGMTLKVKPYTPKDRVFLILGITAPVPEWEPYLAAAA